MRIVLCGYHWTGCKALELLLEEGHEVYVYTHPTENCIADLEGLCIRKNIKYSLDKIEAANLPFIPDMICSIYYRWFIKQDVINIVNGKIFNLHPALLPRHHGCSSLAQAVATGEEECGFAYHYVEAGCDTGNIILQKAIKIEDFDTQLTLYNRVMFESMDSFLEVLHMVERGYGGEKPKYKNQEITTYRQLQKILLGGGKMIVYGCGGHARSIVNTLLEFNINLQFLLVDEFVYNDEIILGCRTQREYELEDKDGYIIAIGDNNKRKELYDSLSDQHKGYCISVVSVYSCMGVDSKVGMGTFIAPNAYLGPQVIVGNNSVINTGSIVEHETTIGDNTHIAPHATICGRAKIGNNVFCGAGSTVIDNVVICDNVIIGAGAVVKEDIIEPGTYAGIPAKKIK